MKTDFLVIGSGIAGLSFALKTAKKGKVCIITKASGDESNTKYAQGGIAAVMPGADSYEKHIEDTLVCGAGLCDEQVVSTVVREAEKGIQELLDWGVQFDKDEKGSFDLAREGGHSEHRILHHKDITGFEIERALLEEAEANENITILPHHFAIDLITQHHLGKNVTKASNDIECYGAYVLDQESGKIFTLLSKLTLVATGGCGQAYASTTNPRIATGDGIAMVYRAKGAVADMEFVQFHPTALHQPGVSPAFLITEALRGHGAILRDHDGFAFMEKYDTRGSLAPRDIVARAIDNEIKVNGLEHVWLDATMIPEKDLADKFPNITDRCLSAGINIKKDFIPVAPAAHYLCGGIRVDINGASTINNLFAVGECARTGLHGANRLASNSLLEAIVFGKRAAEKAISNIDRIDLQAGIPEWDAKGTADPEELILITQSRKELQQIMTSYVGIVRSNLRLQRALDRLHILYEETEELYRRTTVSVTLGELRNLVTVAFLIIRGARERRENAGLHFNIDYPQPKTYENN